MTAPAALDVALPAMVDVALGDLYAAAGIAEFNVAIDRLRAAIAAYGRECAAEAEARAGAETRRMAELGLAERQMGVNAELDAYREGRKHGYGDGYAAALAEVDAACERLAWFLLSTDGVPAARGWCELRLGVEIQEDEPDAGLPKGLLWVFGENGDVHPTPTAAILAAAAALDSTDPTPDTTGKDTPS